MMKTTKFQLPPNWPCLLEKQWAFICTDIEDGEYQTFVICEKISTAKDFWGLFYNIAPISTATQNKPNINYHLMINNLKPCWSSPGGTIRINLTYENFWIDHPVSQKKDVLFELFIRSCTILISEENDEISETITGVSVRNSSTIRDKKGKSMKSCAALTFWTSKKPSESFLKNLKNAIELPKSTPTYKSNNERN